MRTINEEISSKFKSEQHRGLVNLAYTCNQIVREQSGLLKTFDMTLQQYNILRILKGSHPEQLSMQEIVKRMLDKSPNATRLADKLLKKELIVRTTPPNDRRVVFLSITEEGINFLNEINVDFEEELDRVGSRLSKEEAETFNELLDKLRNSES